MIFKLFDAMFTPKHPRGYTGRHRAEFAPATARNRSRAKVVTGREATVH